MELHELVTEIKLLDRRLTLYEEKYGILSEDFYKALVAGNLSNFDDFDETRTDFSRWKGIYETWLRRKEANDEKAILASFEKGEFQSILTPERREKLERYASNTLKKSKPTNDSS